jgi:hypothetical protein
VNASGGNWSNPANWLNGLIPGQDDIANITLAGTYTVTLDVDPTVSQLVMGNNTGTQTLNTNGRTLTVRNATTTTAGAVVSVSEGTLVVGSSASVVSLSILNDGRVTVQNNAVLTVTGVLNWDSGTLTNGGKLSIAGAVANLTSGSFKFIDGIFENGGTVNYTGTNLRFGRDAQNLAARIENLAGGTFIVDGDGDFEQHNGSVNLAFNNAGTFIKRNAATTVFNTNVPFNTTGTVQIEAGTLQFNASTTLGGSIVSSGTGTVLFTGGSHTVATGVQFTQSAVTVQNATLTIQAGAVASFTALTIDGGHVVLGENRTLATLTITGDGRVTVQNNAVLTVTGVLNWDSGTLTNGGKLSIAGAVANLTSGSFKFIDGIFENGGTVNYTGTNLRFGRDAQNLAARIENLAGGTFIVDGDGDFEQHNGSVNLALNNAGTFIKRNAATTVFNTNVPFNTTGTVQIEAGTLQFNASTTLGGSIVSSGTGTMLFTGGSHTVATGVQFTQSAVTVQNATLTIQAGAVANLTTLTIDGGHGVLWGKPQSGGADDHGGRAGDGAERAVLTVTGTLNWDRGTLSSGGKLSIAVGAVANLTSGNFKFIDGIFENGRDGELHGDKPALWAGRAEPGGADRESGRGTFIVDGDGDFEQHNGSVNLAFNNAGTFIKRNAATTVFNTNVPFNTTGTVQIEAGTLQFNASTTLGGSIVSSGTGTVLFTGGSHTVATGVQFTQSAVTVQNATLTIQAGAVANLTTLTIDGGHVVLGENRSLAALTITGDGRVTVQNGAVLTVTGTLNWDRGR